MDTIYLIRHTTPAVAKGICYGQTDLDVTDSFLPEAESIRLHLPAGIGAVYSSPLKRCSLLARELFPSHPVTLMPDLMEIDCGCWEMRAWDELPPEEVEPWMSNFVQLAIPGGESYEDLYTRVARCWETIKKEKGAADAAVVAHGGVLRSILAGIGGVALIDSFKAFPLHYGCVVRVFRTPAGWDYEVLSSQAPAEKEQHKPKSFYR
jgi:alpha-ribazole phosphatase